MPLDQWQDGASATPTKPVPVCDHPGDKNPCTRGNGSSLCCLSLSVTPCGPGQPDHVPPLFQVQEKLLLSACHLLVSLATTVRPVFLISIPAVQKVFNRITDTSAQRLPDKVLQLCARQGITVAVCQKLSISSCSIGKNTQLQLLNLTCFSLADTDPECTAIAVLAYGFWHMERVGETSVSILDTSLQMNVLQNYWKATAEMGILLHWALAWRYKVLYKHVLPV